MLEVIVFKFLVRKGKPLIRSDQFEVIEMPKTFKAKNLHGARFPDLNVFFKKENLEKRVGTMKGSIEFSLVCLSERRIIGLSTIKAMAIQSVKELIEEKKAETEALSNILLNMKEHK